MAALLALQMANNRVARWGQATGAIKRITRVKRRNGSFTLPDAYRPCSTARHNGRKEHLHMGDKGGKKDKARSKQQQDAKQKAEVKRNEEKSPRKTS